MKHTLKYKIPYFEEGDIITGEEEMRRWETVDSHLHAIFEIFGDGVVDGWIIESDFGLKARISNGKAYIYGIVVETIDSYLLINLFPSTKNYIYAILNEDSRSKRSVAFSALTSKIEDSSYLLIGTVTTDDRNVVSIDISSRKNINFTEKIESLLKSHSHSGEKGACNKIDLSNEVCGKIGKDNLPDLSADMIVEGVLPKNVLPEIVHSELVGAGKISHNEIDEFIESINTKNMEKISNLSYAKTMNILAGISERYPEIKDEFSDFFQHKVVNKTGVSEKPEEDYIILKEWNKFKYEDFDAYSGISITKEGVMELSTIDEKVKFKEIGSAQFSCEFLEETEVYKISSRIESRSDSDVKYKYSVDDGKWSDWMDFQDPIGKKCKKIQVCITIVPSLDNLFASSILSVSIIGKSNSNIFLAKKKEDVDFYTIQIINNTIVFKKGDEIVSRIDGKGIPKGVGQDLSEFKNITGFDSGFNTAWISDFETNRIMEINSKGELIRGFYGCEFNNEASRDLEPIHCVYNPSGLLFISFNKNIDFNSVEMKAISIKVGAVKINLSECDHACVGLEDGKPVVENINTVKIIIPDSMRSLIEAKMKDLPISVCMDNGFVLNENRKRSSSENEILCEIGNIFIVNMSNPIDVAFIPSENDFNQNDNPNVVILKCSSKSRSISVVQLNMRGQCVFSSSKLSVGVRTNHGSIEKHDGRYFIADSSGKRAIMLNANSDIIWEYNSSRHVVGFYINYDNRNVAIDGEEYILHEISDFDNIYSKRISLLDPWGKSKVLQDDIPVANFSMSYVKNLILEGQ
jgi:hypothetical protein